MNFRGNPVLYTTNMQEYGSCLGSEGMGHSQDLDNAFPSYSGPHAHDQYLSRDRHPAFHSTSLHGIDSFTGSGNLGHIQNLDMPSSVYLNPDAHDQYSSEALEMSLFNTGFNGSFDEFDAFDHGNDMAAVAFGNNPMQPYSDQNEMGGVFSDKSSGPVPQFNSMPNYNIATAPQGTINPAFLSITMYSETENTFKPPGEQPCSSLSFPVASTETEFSNPSAPVDYQSNNHGTYQIKEPSLHGCGSQLDNNAFDDQIPDRMDFHNIDLGAYGAQYVPVYGQDSQSGNEISEAQNPACTLQPAHPNYSTVPNWGLTQPIQDTQHTYGEVQHQVAEYDVPFTHLPQQTPMSQKSALNYVPPKHTHPDIEHPASNSDEQLGPLIHDPSFRQNVQPPRASAQISVGQRSITNPVASGRVSKPVMTKAGKVAKYRMDGKLRKSTLGPLAERPAEELQAPDIDLTGSDVLCFFPNYIRRPRFLTRMLGNGFSSRALAAIINYYNGTDKTANSINNGCVREARRGWNLSTADEKLSLNQLRAKNVLTVDNSLRIASNDLPLSKSNQGESPRSEVTLLSIAEGLHRWPKMGSRFWTPTAAVIKWCFDNHQENYTVEDIPTLAGRLGVSMPPPYPDLNYDQELLVFVEDHVLKMKQGHSCEECT